MLTTKNTLLSYILKFEVRSYTIHLYRWDNGLIGFDAYTPQGIWALHGGGYTKVRDVYKHIDSKLRFIEGVYTHLDSTTPIYENWGA